MINYKIIELWSVQDIYIYIYILNVFKILGGIIFTGQGWDGNDL